MKYLLGRKVQKYTFYFRERCTAGCLLDNRTGAKRFDSEVEARKMAIELRWKDPIIQKAFL